MELWEDKVISLFLMGILTIIAALVPIWLLQHFKETLTNKNSRRKLDKALSLLNCFVGGVFLATTLVHMLPEAREATEHYMEELEIEIEFPVTEFTVCIGVFVVMILEHMVMVFRRATGQEEDDKKMIIQNEAGASHIELEKSSSGSGNDHTPGVKTSVASGPHLSASGAHDQERPRSISRASSLIASGSFKISEAETAGHGHSHLGPDDLASFRSFVLLLAISIHTVFEGLAIGLQDAATGVWTLFTAIIVHKTIIAFSLGLQFAESLKKKSKAILFMSIFSVLSPIGIAIGTAVSSGGAGDSLAADVVEGVLQCIATGTLLYVSFFEVLMGEIGNDHSLLKILLIILGYAVMTLLMLFVHE